METLLPFKPVELGDRAAIERRTVPSGLTNCDLAFANMYCWQESYRSEWCEVDGLLVIRFRIDGGERIGMPDAVDGIGDPHDGGRADITPAAVGHDLLQAADVGDDDRRGELVGDLRHAALRGAPIGQHDEIGRREIVADGRIGNEPVVEDHLLPESRLGDLSPIGSGIGIKLPRHDQPTPLGTSCPLQAGPGIEQQVEPLVVADEPEKEGIAQRRIDAEARAGLRAVDPLAVLFETRMGREERRSIRVGAQLAHHLVGHADETVDRTQEIAVEGAVEKVRFVRLDVVDLADHLRQAVAACQAGDRTEAGGHEGGPVFQQEHVGALGRQLPSHAPPVPRQAGVDRTADPQIGRRRGRDRLALSREEERGILPREGAEVDRMAAALVDAPHGLHDRSQTAAIGMRGTEDGDFHKHTNPVGRNAGRARPTTRQGRIQRYE